jgi:hypothetical protein
VIVLFLVILAPCYRDRWLLFLVIESLSLSYLRNIHFFLLLYIFLLIGVEVLLSIETKHWHVFVMLKEERVLEFGFERKD